MASRRISNAMRASQAPVKHSSHFAFPVVNQMSLASRSLKASGRHGMQMLAWQHGRRYSTAPGPGTKLLHREHWCGSAGGLGACSGLKNEVCVGCVWRAALDADGKLDPNRPVLKGSLAGPEIRLDVTWVASDLNGSLDKPGLGLGLVSMASDSNKGVSTSEG
jgi:hypothetical protein